jgi:hypothetical protein
LAPRNIVQTEVKANMIQAMFTGRIDPNRALSHVPSL